MIPVPVVGLGCSMPVAILIMVAVASLFLSMVISAEDIPPPQIRTNSIRRNIPRNDPSNHNSAHRTKQAFVHHTVKTQPAYIKTLRMSDELSPIVARFERENRRDREKHYNHQQEEALSPPVNHLNKPVASKHYACPPTSLESLRKRYGTRQSLWGEWSNAETRAFYRTQLPRALQIDGALGLTLEERAQLASEARHALRVYSRERCYLPGRVAARIYDGLRHFQLFGYWSCDGMNWTEVKEKYARDGRILLGENVSPADLEMYVYRKIVDRACATNAIFDHYASQGSVEHGQLLTLIKGIFAIEKIKSSRPPRNQEKDVIMAELERQLEDERELAMYVRTVPFQKNEESLEDSREASREASIDRDMEYSSDEEGSLNSLSMSVSVPLPELVSPSAVFNQSINCVGETADEGMNLIMQFLFIALGKGEQLRYLIESHVNVSPFH